MFIKGNMNIDILIKNKLYVSIASYPWNCKEKSALFFSGYGSLFPFSDKSEKKTFGIIEQYIKGKYLHHLTLVPKGSHGWVEKP